MYPNAKDLVAQTLTLDSDLESPSVGQVRVTSYMAQGLFGAMVAEAEDSDITARVGSALSRNRTARGTGVVIFIPPGRYYVSSTIRLDQLYGVTLEGAGEQATELVWSGGRTSPMFIINRCQKARLRGFSITVPASSPLLEAVRIQNGEEYTGDGYWPGLDSSQCVLEDILVRGQGNCGTGVRVFLYDHNSDTKNDHHKFYRLGITGCRHAAYVVEGTNTKAVGIYDSTIIGTVGGVQILSYCVLTVANMCPLTMNTDGTLGALGDPAVNSGSPVYNKGGAFRCSGGQYAGATVANWYIGARNSPCLIEDIYVEKSARLLVVPDYASGSVGAFPITLRAVTYNVLDGTTPADLEIIQCAVDTLRIDSCEFGQRTAGEQLRIRLTQKVAGAWTMVNTTISNDGNGVVFVAGVPANADYTTTNLGYRAGALGALGAAA